MAWMIGAAVVRGELDNTVEGVTTGRIWVLGRDAPLELRLHGDCWRDLAGGRVEFENPAPEFNPQLAAGLAGCQHGLVGDITASRRQRGAGGPGPGPGPGPLGGPPAAWHNCLYVEWFSEANGRVLIESDRFEVRPGEARWRMDGDAEQAQKLANLQAMRDYLAAVVGRRAPGGAPPGAGAGGEREWDERLAESEQLTDVYQEVLDKYDDDPDAEQKKAFVMGWDHLLGELADRHEGGHRAARACAPDAFPGLAGEEGGPEEDGGEWDGGGPFADEAVAHPLQEQAEELAVRASDLMPLERPAGSPSCRLVSQLGEVSARLAAALDQGEDDYRPEAGHVLAVLKRCLQRLADAAAACGEIIGVEDDPDQRQALEALHRDLFRMRDGMVGMCRELRRE